MKNSMESIQDIKILGEQNGLAEHEFMQRLSQIFFLRKGVQKAYLLKAIYNSKNEIKIMLCLKTNTNFDESYMKKIAITFSSMFNKNQMLDIMLINDIQENQIRKTAKPFFEVDSSH